jgi:hypothetical protein
MKQPEEHVISVHSKERWQRRRREIEEWGQLHRQIRREKETAPFLDCQVDAELLPALLLLNDMEIGTQYSCAGVSVLDDPMNHSLYAYVTVMESQQSITFLQFLQERMRHRLLVIYEPGRKRYDISSFYIQHNRSFCLLLYRYALHWKAHTSVVK